MKAPRGILAVLSPETAPVDLGRVGGRVVARAEAQAAARNHVADVAEALHQVRVSLKAFRAIAALAGVRRPRLARTFDHEARDLGRLLAGLRDREVLQKTCRNELDDWAGCPAELARALEAGLPPVPRGRDLRKALAEARFGLRRLGQRWRATTGRPLDLDQGRKAWRQGVRKWRCLRRDCRDGGASAFHEWRKATKRLEYQAWVLGVDRTPSGRRWLSELHRLQERQGLEHDLTVFRRHLRQDPSGSPVPGRSEFLDRITRRRRRLRRWCVEESRGWPRQLARLLDEIPPDRGQAGHPAVGTAGSLCADR